MNNIIAFDKRFIDYQEFIKFLADNKVNLKFQNSSYNHATVVLSNILDNSDNVYVYDYSLEGDFAYQNEDFMNSLKRFF